MCVCGYFCKYFTFHYKCAKRIYMMDVHFQMFFIRYLFMNILILGSCDTMNHVGNLA